MNFIEVSLCWNCIVFVLFLLKLVKRVLVVVAAPWPPGSHRVLQSCHQWALTVAPLFDEEMKQRDVQISHLRMYLRMQKAESQTWSVETKCCIRFRTWWWFQICFIFNPTWGNDPIWLIFFRWVEKLEKHWTMFYCIWLPLLSSILWTSTNQTYWDRGTILQYRLKLRTRSSCRTCAIFMNSVADPVLAMTSSPFSMVILTQSVPCAPSARDNVPAVLSPKLRHAAMPKFGMV